MNKKEWAEKLNGREYGNELNPGEAAQAKNDGIVIVFGYSDDLMELCGAIRGEVDCYDGGTAYFDQKGLLKNECENNECPYFQSKKKECKTIEAIWGATGPADWTYETKIPHETFNIFEDGSVYCEGIVFEIGELAK